LPSFRSKSAPTTGSLGRCRSPTPRSGRRGQASRSTLGGNTRMRSSPLPSPQSPVAAQRGQGMNAETLRRTARAYGRGCMAMLPACTDGWLTRCLEDGRQEARAVGVEAPGLHDPSGRVRRAEAPHPPDHLLSGPVPSSRRATNVWTSSPGSPQARHWSAMHVSVITTTTTIQARRSGTGALAIHGTA
jgi:hypothetical protein